MTFTNADFARVAARLSQRLAEKTADLAYGMWNPVFCEADATTEASTFLAALEIEAQHWRRHIAQAIEAQRAETVKQDSVADESAVGNADASKP